MEAKATETVKTQVELEEELLKEIEEIAAVFCMKCDVN